MIFKRSLNISQLLDKKSHFLLGPRLTGKSSLIRNTIAGDNSVVIDLLNDDIAQRLLRRPTSLSELIPSNVNRVVLDEIQKLPVLLNEVHRLIEERHLTFLLTGSSARKLRHGTANLLGGRAWETHLFPLTSRELGGALDLLTYLNRGGLPSIYNSQYSQDELRNYVNLYLKEEIQAEALLRRLDHFVRFLDVVALSSSEEINYEAVGNDAGVPSRTVAHFFQILEDTLIGFTLPPFLQSKKRKAIKRSKFYLFDVGVAGAMARRGVVEEGSESFGKAFEHFLIQELRAYLSYCKPGETLCYWRTTAQHEVDAVIGSEAAIEIKSTERLGERHLSGLNALAEEGIVKRFYAVSRDPVRRKSGVVEILPWEEFLVDLWAGKIV